MTDERPPVTEARPADPQVAERMSRWLAEAGAPPWIRNQVARYRHEAAGWRVKLREAQADLADAKFRGRQVETELASLMAELESLRLAEARRLAVVRHGLPEAMGKRLRGSTPAEIDADAAGLTASGVKWGGR